MHEFSDLVESCATFTLRALEELEVSTIQSLQTSAATPLVKALQMIRLEKTILAVGIFSVFEAILQDGLRCSNGFKEAKEILRQKGDLILLSKFTDLDLAINALKHGRGRSYDALVEKDGGTLESEVKQPNQDFFHEGDVSEISSLINIDDKFIYYCIDIIEKVSKSIHESRPDVIL